MVEAGARAMWGEGYDNNPHIHDAIHSDMRACLSAALAAAEAEGVILTKVPGSDDGAYSQNPGRREFARIWEKCRAATLAGKVTL
jgi:hypothetical protein